MSIAYFLIGMMVGGSLGFLLFAMLTVGRSIEDRFELIEGKRKYVGQVPPKAPPSARDDQPWA